MDEQSMDAPVDDKSFCILRATLVENVSVEPLRPWQNNEGRIPHVGAIAKGILAIQRNLVASESRLSCAIQLTN